MYVANAAFWWALGAGTAASCQLSGDIPLTDEVLDALRTAANVALLAIPAILCLFPETEQERAARLARRRGPRAARSRKATRANARRRQTRTGRVPCRRR